MKAAFLRLYRWPSLLERHTPSCSFAFVVLLNDLIIGDIRAVVIRLIVQELRGTTDG
jgi:hypothetical protein